MDGAVHPARNDLVYAYDTAATHRILVSSFSIAAADLLDLAPGSAFVAHPASGLCSPSGESTGGASHPPELMDTPLAYWLARHRFRGRQLIDTLLDLPMVLPPAVAGIALLVAFGRRGLVGASLNELGITLAFTQTAVVLAQLFVAAPFYVKAAIAGFGAVDQDLEQAAALDGASGWGIFRYITVPLAWPTLFGGAVMTWARALGEFGATIIFAGNFPGRTQTMPLAIYIGFELDLNVALTLAVILLATSFFVLFVVKGLLRQRVSVA